MNILNKTENTCNDCTKIIYSAFINDLYNLSYKGYIPSHGNKRFFQINHSIEHKSKTPKSLFLFLDFMMVQMATCSKEELKHSQTFLISDYQKFRKIKHIKTARNEINIALAFFKNCSFNYDGIEENILSFEKKGRNQITVTFSSAFFQETTRIAKYPLVLAMVGYTQLETDIGRYLVDQYSCRIQKKSLQILTLLKHAHSLPIYEQIKQKGQINQRIKTPLLTAIKSLKNIGIITSYNFINKQRKMISEEDFLTLKACEFERLLIQFELAEKFEPERRQSRKIKEANNYIKSSKQH